MNVNMLKGNLRLSAMRLKKANANLGTLKSGPRSHAIRSKEAF